MINIFSQISPNKNFWDWFGKNENRLFNLEKEQNKLLDELKVQLNKIDTNLVFEFSTIQNGKREFVISADGYKKSFPAVEKLFNAAPKFERWVITKFRPRREKLYNIDYKGIKVTPDEVAFELVPHNNKINITLFIKNYNESDKSIYGAIVFLFLDAALGEYDVETKVGAIDMKSSKDISNFDDNSWALMCYDYF